MRFSEIFLDHSGFVLPQSEWEHSGNGILYTSVALVLGFDVPFFELLEKCKLRPGLYARTPENAFGNQSWDDYLGIAAASIYLKRKDVARDVLCYGVVHFFFFNSDGKLEKKDFLGRFPQLWVLFIVAAFPFLSYAVAPLLWIIQKTFKLKTEDSSGFQLQWLFLESCKNAGIKFNKLETANVLLFEAFTKYYQSGHPFICAVENKSISERLSVI